MEKLKPGRKPLPAHLKVHMVGAYLTKAQKELIVNKYGSLTQAIKAEILDKLMQDGHSNSTGNGQPVDGQ